MAGVFGVDCTSVGSDLNWFGSVAGNWRRMGCGVPPGDQIPIFFTFYWTHTQREKEKRIFNLYSEIFHLCYRILQIKACIQIEE